MKDLTRKNNEVYNSDNIYILRAYGKNTNLIKVGYSSNIHKRLQSYYVANPLIEVLFTFYIPTGMKFEKKLHKNFKSYVLREWYTEDKLEDILRFISKEEEKKIINFRGKTCTVNELMDLTKYSGDFILKNLDSNNNFEAPMRLYYEINDGIGKNENYISEVEKPIEDTWWKIKTN